jgi:hypothetical protein
MTPVKWLQTKQQLTEFMRWRSGKGPMTQAVRDAMERHDMTYGLIYLTKKTSDGFELN